MLLTINGSVIDTRNIYEITPVETADKGGNAQCFSFSIKFLNQKKKEIQTSGYEEYTRDKGVAPNYDVNNWLNYWEQKEKYIPLAKARLEAFRSKIIAHWQKDPSPIPSINLFDE